MAVIIYGTREYGLVDEYQGELASTTFFHLWFVPVFPVGSTWITHQSPTQRQGHSITLYGKSVAAGYLRVWGPILALVGTGVFKSGSPIGAVLALAAIALCAWSWRWRTLRGERARRESDFNYVAFGTRVHPRRLDAEARAQLRRVLDQQWNARAGAQTGSPDDVARHGTTDPALAVIAYGLLRLAAISRVTERRGKGTEDADADRILDGDHVPTAATDGPYRGGAEPAAATAAGGATLGELVAARAAADSVSHARLEPTKAELGAMLRRRRRRYRLGIAAALVFGVAGATMFVKSVRPAIDVSLAQLRAIHPPTHRYVNVTCDAVVGPMWQETSRDGDVENQIVLCELGAYHLPVKLDADASIPTRIVHGELRDIPESALWVRDGLRREPSIDDASLFVYVDTRRASHRGFELALGLAFMLAGPLVIGLYVRWSRKNRDALTSS